MHVQQCVCRMIRLQNAHVNVAARFMFLQFGSNLVRDDLVQICKRCSTLRIRFNMPVDKWWEAFETGEGDEGVESDDEEDPSPQFA